MARFFGRHKNQAEEDFRRFEQEIYLNPSPHPSYNPHEQEEDTPAQYGYPSINPSLSTQPRHFEQGYHTALRNPPYADSLSRPLSDNRQASSMRADQHKLSHLRDYRQAPSQDELKGLGFWQDDQDEVSDTPDHWAEQPSPFKFVIALLGLVAMIVIIWFGYRWLSQPSPDGTAFIHAEPGPFKVKPEQPGGLEIPYQDKLIYGRISPESSAPVERLLPPSEQPMPLPPEEQPYQGQETQPQPQPLPPGYPVGQPAPYQQPVYQGPAAVPNQALGYAEGGQTIPGSQPQSNYVPSSPQPQHQHPQQPHPAPPPGLPSEGKINPQHDLQTSANPSPAQYAPSSAPETRVSTPHTYPPITPLLEDSPTPERTAAKAEGTATAFYVQLGTLPTETAAKQELERLSRKHRQELTDLDGFVRISETVDGKKVYRALVGPFRTRNAALSKCNKLGSTCRVVQIP